MQHIHLIGPGAAGKTTTGKALAARLGYPLVDLDREYLKQGDIDNDISTRGYPFYVKRNVDLYLELRERQTRPALFVLSSGFMTYDSNIHKAIVDVHRSILTSPTTILVMATFDQASCEDETVKRQLLRDYARPADEERRVIRERFPVYVEMGAIQAATDKPIDKVVDEILTQLPGAASGSAR